MTEPEFVKDVFTGRRKSRAERDLLLAEMLEGHGPYVRINVSEITFKRAQFFPLVFRVHPDSAAEDATFENESRPNPEPTRKVFATPANYRCVHCRYDGPFHAFPPTPLIRCPLCMCIGNAAAFALSGNQERFKI